MRSRSSINYWIAFADIVFVLFICGLVGAVIFRREAAEKQRANEVLAATNAELRAKLARAYQCKAVEPFLKAISGCIEDALQVKGAVPVDSCSMALSDELIKFEFKSARPAAPERAAAIMNCVYSGISKVQKERPEEFRNIDALAINGYTDCRGESTFNMQLGAERAQTLYRLLERNLDSDARMAVGGPARTEFLSKLVIRSFGENRGSSKCTEAGEMPADRRVTISVEMRRDGIQAGEAE